MQNAEPARYLSSGDVAKLAKVSTAMVRVWEREGKLAAAIRTEGGMRLFERADVERFLKVRNNGFTEG